MLRQEPDEQLVVERILEYVSWSIPWQRQLWNIGSVATLYEVVEASEAVVDGALAPAALKVFSRDASRVIGPDPGVGDGAVRQRVHELMKTDLRANSVDWIELRDLAAMATDGYLSRWARAIEAGTNDLGNEHRARLFASHVKWLGFSGDFIHRWLTYQTRHRADEVSLAELLLQADEDLANREPREHEVLVPCTGAPRIDVPGVAPPSWLDGPAMTDKLEAVDDARGVAHNGGFCFAISALDPESAALRARELLDRWASRVELSTPKALQLTGPIWVEGKRNRHRATGARRAVEVGALQREHLIYADLDDDTPSAQVDDALQLARPLESGGLAAAIAGGWAAVEALLVGGAEHKVVAAERLAAIVACSYPRAELTTLAYLHEAHAQDRLADQIAAADSNLARARLAADAIEQGRLSVGTALADQAAVDRMRQILTDPRETLARVRQYVEDGILRLYRQRNLIVHGGRVSGHLRTATLEAVAALVGAGLDRIAHAWFVDGRTPLQLAARANLALELVGSSAGTAVTDLLEP